MTQTTADQVLTAPAAPLVVGSTDQQETTAAQVLVEYIRNQRSVLVEAERDLRDGSHEVHDVRVAVRRLRSLLRTFEAMFTPGSAEVLESELRWFGGLLGAVRDPEVMRIRLLDLVADQPESVIIGPVAARVQYELIAERERHLAIVVATLDSSRYSELVDALDRWAAAPPFVPAAMRMRASALRAHVKTSRRVLARRLNAASKRNATDEATHRARKAAKRARYAVEAAAPAYSRKRIRREIRQIRGLQESLGEFQDSVVAMETLAWLGDVANRSSGESGFTFGVLYAAEKKRRDRALRTARRQFAKAAR